MKTLLKGLIAIAAVATSMAAHAGLILSGTSTYATARDCVAGVSGCDSVSPIVYSTAGGLPGATTSSVTQLPPGYGQSTASATLSGVIGAPVLYASATSTAGTREGASAYGLQSYTYVGTSPITDTFGGSVTYSQTINGSYPLDYGLGTVASIEVFTLGGALFDAGVTVQDNADALGAAANDNSSLYGPPQPVYTLLGSSVYDDPSTNVAGTGSTSVTVTLDPGETIWVLAGVQAFASNGSSVDPNFTTQWTDSANLVAGAPTSVPEPASLWLMVLGLGGLLGLIRWRETLGGRSAQA
jgi:PEP-CTERM motif